MDRPSWWIALTDPQRLTSWRRRHHRLRPLRRHHRCERSGRWTSEHPNVATLKLVLIAPDVDTYTLFDGPNGSSNGADNGNVGLTTGVSSTTEASSI